MINSPGQTLEAFTKRKRCIIRFARRCCFFFPCCGRKKVASALSHAQAKFFSHQILNSSIKFNDKHANARDMTGIQAFVSLQKLTQPVKTHQIQYSSYPIKLIFEFVGPQNRISPAQHKVVLFLFRFPFSYNIVVTFHLRALFFVFQRKIGTYKFINPHHAHPFLGFDSLKIICIYIYRIKM